MAQRVLCRLATPFTTDGALDEPALRLMLRRLADLEIGVLLGNPGAGEGHALTLAELDRLYRVGVELCGGKVPVHANPPEQPTARDTREHLQLAAAAGVDLVVLYGPAGRHGYKPTDGELTAYFDDVLSAVKHPVAIAPDPTTGYAAKLDVVLKACASHRHVEALQMGDVGEEFVLQVKERAGSDVEWFVPSPATINVLRLGASGVLSAEANIIPLTCRRYVELCGTGGGAIDEANRLYLQIRRFLQYVSKWGPSQARWLKMCLSVLKLPGGTAVVREPYRLPPREEIDKFSAGLLKLGIPEIDECARAARV